jgi:lipopolysaccharide/colanic/teichoic acid biosynthesis glycosyltransferase
MKPQRTRKIRLMPQNSEIRHHLDYQNVEEIKPFLVASTPASTLKVPKRVEYRSELKLATIDTLLLMSTLIGTVLPAHWWMPGDALQESLFISVNIVLAVSLAIALGYFELKDGLYSLGKAILLAVSLWVLNGIMLFIMQDFSIQTVLSHGFFLAIAAPVSAYFHYSASESYRVKNTSSIYYHLEKALKRAFDFSASLLGLAVISPLILVTALLIRLESCGTVIYQQVRIGERERKFRMLKFRSMRQDSDSFQRESKTVLYKIDNDPRITRIGKIIRKLSIDELPQLWNVVLGDMSLVGPRPPIECEYNVMTWYHKRKFEATPGLTGLWQIVGRVNKQRDFNAVAAYDVYYIENWCLIRDLEILINRLRCILH